MGMFSDYQSIKKQSKAMAKTHDVKGSLATMQSKLESLNASMTQTVQGHAMSQGVECTATITSAQQTGTMVNFAPVCQLGLIVMVPGGSPVAVSRAETVQPIHLARVVPGQALTVRVMADDPNDLFIDWDR